MERIETDEQILDVIMNPEMPFEKIQSAVALEKEAKRDTAEQEAEFDGEKLQKYKDNDFDNFNLFEISYSHSDRKCEHVEYDVSNFSKKKIFDLSHVVAL